MAPMWPGEYGPCATIRPSGSNTATEKSWPSRACSEYAVLCTVVPTSTAMDCSAPHTTPSVMGSTRAPSLDGHQAPRQGDRQDDEQTRRPTSHGAVATSTIRLAYSSTLATAPGGSTEVDSRSSTMAGPASCMPAASL